MMSNRQDVSKNLIPKPGWQHISLKYKKLILPELGILGWLHFTKAFDQALDADCDKGEYEIHSIGNGERNRWVEEKDYILSPKSKEISHNLGFSSRQYFSTLFKRVTGVSPDEFILETS